MVGFNVVDFGKFEALPQLSQSCSRHLYDTVNILQVVICRHLKLLPVVRLVVKF